MADTFDMYARLRHPRYAAALLGVCVAAFFSNHLAVSRCA